MFNICTGIKFGLISMTLPLKVGREVGYRKPCYILNIERNTTMQLNNVRMIRKLYDDLCKKIEKNTWTFLEMFFT